MIVGLVLADDHEMMREGLKSLLEKELGIEVVGEAENGKETVELVGKVSSGRNLVRSVFDAGASGYVRKDRAYEETYSRDSHCR